jgi:hypothetical protein
MFHAPAQGSHTSSAHSTIFFFVVVFVFVFVSVVVVLRLLLLRSHRSQAASHTAGPLTRILPRPAAGRCQETATAALHRHRS